MIQSGILDPNKSCDSCSSKDVKMCDIHVDHGGEIVPVWHCNGCNTAFTGRGYQMATMYRNSQFSNKIDVNDINGPIIDSNDYTTRQNIADSVRKDLDNNSYSTLGTKVRNIIDEQVRMNIDHKIMTLEISNKTLVKEVDELKEKIKDPHQLAMNQMRERVFGFKLKQ